MNETTARTGTAARCACGERLIVASGLGQRSNTWQHADALVECQSPAPVETSTWTAANERCEHGVRLIDGCLDGCTVAAV